MKLLPPTQLFVERFGSPLGVGTATPRVSWIIPGAPAGWVSRRAQAEAVDSDGRREIRAIGARGLTAPWPFAPLRSGEERVVRIRVTGTDDEAHWSDWSEPLHVEAGVLDPQAWSAQFVSAPWIEDTRIDQRPPLLRGTFRLRAPVSSARLRSSSLGLHEIELEGVRVGDDVLSPGWTSFSHRLRYLTHDVSRQLSELSAAGPVDVAVGAWLGDGWYRGRLGWNDRVRNQWGARLAVMVQLEVRYTDGTSEVFGSDEQWKASHGPILRSGLYDGERYDGALLPPAWSTSDFDDRGWRPVDVLPRPEAEPVAYDGPPVRVTEIVAPRSITHNPGGSHQFDFGQNLVGRLRIRDADVAQGGLRIRHAEMMQSGELSIRPLRTAEALDTWWPPADEGEHDWAPRFTFHGFRYADIEGFASEPTAASVQAEVLHSDMRRTGWFRCSDPLLERLHENVVWSMRGNFVDVPTDCPQRDERLGWTGDLQVFGPTAAFLFDCSGVLRSWLRDVAADQRSDGSIPHFIPNVPDLEFEPGFAAVWGDVATLTPWDLYEAYGDVDMLREQYATARRWVDGLRQIAEGGVLVLGQYQFGDWLDPTAPAENPHLVRADPELLATAYFQRSARVLARIASVLGENADAREYGELAARIRHAFLDRFSPAPGVLSDDAQASYAVAISFDLFDDEDARQRAGDRLAGLVREQDHRIGTGFAGTPVICQALAATGHLDDAYAMLLQTECPSWLYPVTQGATTIWERWDSLRPDGQINDASMTSFNHYALGAVAAFLHRDVAGISPAAPGYEEILFRPRPGGGLTSAGATLDTPFGTASIDWERSADAWVVHTKVPVGATAILDLTAVGGAVELLSHGSRTTTVAHETLVL